MTTYVKNTDSSSHGFSNRLLYFITANNFLKFEHYNDEEVDERECVSVVQWAGKTHSALVSKRIAASR